MNEHEQIGVVIFAVISWGVQLGVIIHILRVLETIARLLTVPSLVS